jgi:hypothetical protein
MTGWLIAMAISFPGHASYDTLYALREGRLWQFSGLQPPIVSVLLGAFDRALPGTALYQLFVQALLYVPLLMFMSGRPVSLASSVFLAFLTLSPVTILYEGIVWKDVLFANATSGACLLAALPLGRWAPAYERVLAYLGASALFLLACLTRANGIVVPLLLVPAVLSQQLPSLRWRGALGCAALAVTSLVFTTALINHALVGENASLRVALRTTFVFDIAGIAASNPDAAASELAHFGIDGQAVAAEAKSTYTPQRWDPLMRTPIIGAKLLYSPQLLEAWSAAIMASPIAYVRHRLSHFLWTIAPPDPLACLPMVTGVAPAGKLNAEVGLQPGRSAGDQRLWDLAQPLFGTPLFKHWIYLSIGIVLGGIGLLRRFFSSLGVVAAAVAWSAVLFGTSWAVVGLACDFRYLFLLELAVPLSALLISMGWTDVFSRISGPSTPQPLSP